MLLLLLFRWVNPISRILSCSDRIDPVQHGSTINLFRWGRYHSISCVPYTALQIGLEPRPPMEDAMSQRTRLRTPVLQSRCVREANSDGLESGGVRDNSLSPFPCSLGRTMRAPRERRVRQKMETQEETIKMKALTKYARP
jgi:hypothetical protein